LIVLFTYLLKKYKNKIAIMNFINWNTMIDIGFWSRLTKKKV